MAPHTPCHMACMVSMLSVMNCVMPAIIGSMNAVIAFHVSVRNWLIAFQAVCHASCTFCQMEASQSMNCCHSCRPVSVWVKNHAKAATNALIAVTTSMTGLAFMAALSSHCLAAATSVARLKPLSISTTVATAV